MLAETINDMVAHFDRQQNALIEAIGGQLKEIIDDIKNNQIMNHGKPPYIVDTAETSFLFVDGDGRYKKLSPDFFLNEEKTSEKFDAIYSLPVHGFGMVRFIPVRDGLKSPSDYQSKFTPSAYDDQFLVGLSQYLKLMSESIPQLTAARMAKRLIQMQPVMEANAEEATLNLRDFMQLREVRDAIIEVLGQSLVEGAQRASEMVIEARKQGAGGRK